MKLYQRSWVMNDKQKAKFLFEKWYVNINKKDRRHDNMDPLFSSLAEELFMAGIEFDVAYDTMNSASKSMYPVSETIKFVYSKSPFRKNKTLNEFTKDWHEILNKQAKQAFFSFYTINDNTNEQASAKQKTNSGTKKMKTDDEMNEEHFWNSVKEVSKDNPWLFDEDK